MNQKYLLFFKQSCKTAKLLRVIDIFRNNNESKISVVFQTELQNGKASSSYRYVFRNHNESKLSVVFQTGLQNGKASSSYRYIFRNNNESKKISVVFQTELNGKASSSYRYFSETIMNRKYLLFFKQSCKTAKFLRVINIFRNNNESKISVVFHTELHNGKASSSYRYIFRNIFRNNNESKISVVFQTELQNGKASSSYRYIFRNNNESKISAVFQTELQNGKASSSYRYFSETIMNQKSLLFFKQS